MEIQIQKVMTSLILIKKQELHKTRLQMERALISLILLIRPVARALRQTYRKAKLSTKSHLKTEAQ